MKHKLLPALIGAALVGGMGAAQADITVFGHIDTAVRNQDTDVGFVNTATMPATWTTASRIAGTANSDNIDDTNFVCTTCSIGFKGSEDLGNGLKAIFYMDFQYDMFNRNGGGFSGSLTDRDQWIGLAGNFGQVRFGTISTGYKSHGAMLDPLYRTALQGRNYGMQSSLHSNAGEDGEGRADNTVRWDSPSWNGLKVTAHYTLDSSERDGNVVPVTNPRGVEDDDAFGLGAQYSNGGILVFADWLTNNSDDVDNANGDLTAWKVGGKYTINNFAVMGQYEDIEDNVAGFGASGKQEGTLWHLGASYTMGNNMIYAAYGSGSADDILNGTTVGGDDSDQTAYTIAATHQLSKRTMVYAGYNHMEQDNDSGLNGALTGAVAAGYAGTVDDPEQDTIAIGMKHKF